MAPMRRLMALARDTWLWALAAAAILEEQMGRMSHSTGHQHFTSCQCSSSHQCSANHRRFRSLGQHGETGVEPGSPQANSWLWGKGRYWLLWAPKDVSGDFMLKGHCSRTDLVMHLHKREVTCHLPKGEHPHWGRAQGMGWGNAHMTPGQKWGISCPHWYGRLRQHHKRWQIGQDHEMRPKPSWSKKMSISSVSNH